MSKSLIFFISLFFIPACTKYTPFGTEAYISAHPEFPTYRSANRPFEFQIAIHRSWRDSIYVITGKSYNDFYIGWSIAKSEIKEIPNINYIRIKEEQWNQILKQFKTLNFFKQNTPCLEKAYDKKAIFVPDNDECTQIVQTDGDVLSFYAITPENSKGIRFAGVEDNDDIVLFAEFVLITAGVHEKDIPRWENGALN